MPTTYPRQSPDLVDPDGIAEFRPGRQQGSERSVASPRRHLARSPYTAAADRQANRCRSVWQKALGISTAIGFPSDLDAVELLFTSLLVQANTAMLREGTKRDAYGRSRTRAFRQSFLVAYALRIGERLSQATVHAEQEGTLPSAPTSPPAPDGRSRHRGARSREPHPHRTGSRGRPRRTEQSAQLIVPGSAHGHSGNGQKGQ